MKMLHALKIEECNTLYQNKKFKNNKLWHFNLSHIIIKEQYNLNEFKFIKKFSFLQSIPRTPQLIQCSTIDTINQYKHKVPNDLS